MTKEEININIKIEQNILNELIKELLSKNENLQCDIIVNQAKKIDSLKQLLLNK